MYNSTIKSNDFPLYISFTEHVYNSTFISNNFFNNAERIINAYDTNITNYFDGNYYFSIFGSNASSDLDNNGYADNAYNISDNGHLDMHPRVMRYPYTGFEITENSMEIKRVKTTITWKNPVFEHLKSVKYYIKIYRGGDRNDTLVSGYTNNSIEIDFSSSEYAGKTSVVLWIGLGLETNIYEWKFVYIKFIRSPISVINTSIETSETNETSFPIIFLVVLIPVLRDKIKKIRSRY